MTKKKSEKKPNLELVLEEVARKIRPTASDITHTASPSSVATNLPCACCCS